MKALVLLSLFLFFGHSTFSKTIKIGNKNLTQINRKHDGLNRKVLFYESRPKSTASKVLLFFFHGGTGSAQQIAESTRLHDFTSNKNIIVVYPEGTIDKRTRKRYWNDGRDSSAHLADDVDYILSLVDYFVRVHNVDRRKVFASGVSNGGNMTTRLYCEHSDKFKAYMPVAASMVKEMHAKCSPRTGGTFLHIMGTDDVQYKGGKVPCTERLGLCGNGVVGYHEMYKKLLSFNGCNFNKGTYANLPNNSTSDGAWPFKRTFKKGCKSSKFAEGYFEKHATHGYPTPRISNNKAGQDFESSQVIMDFISRVLK